MELRETMRVFTPEDGKTGGYDYEEPRCVLAEGRQLRRHWCMDGCADAHVNLT